MGAHNALCRGEREATDKNGHLPEEHLLGLVEQLVAPRDRVSKGALALRNVASPSGQHGEPLVEPLEEGCRGEHLGTGRSQLDRERKTIQTVADLLHGRRIAVKAEIRLDRQRPLTEQGDGIVLVKLGNGGLPLNRDPQWGSAGKDRLYRPTPEDEVADLRRRLEQMLEVIEDE